MRDVHTAIIDHASAWKGSDFSSSDAVAFDLEDRHRDALRSVVKRARASGRGLQDLTAEETAMPEIEPDLRERTLSAQRIDNFEEPLRRSWEDFDYARPGGESSRTCRRRIVDCVTRLASSHAGTLLVSSHGNALALFLNALDPSFGWEGWKAMGNPDLFKVDFDGTLHWDRAFRFP